MYSFVCLFRWILYTFLFSFICFITWECDKVCSGIGAIICCEIPANELAKGISFYGFEFPGGCLIYETGFGLLTDLDWFWIFWPGVAFNGVLLGIERWLFVFIGFLKA